MNNTTTIQPLLTWAINRGMTVTVYPDMTIISRGEETLNVLPDGNTSYENLVDPDEPMFEMFDTVQEFLDWAEAEL